MEETSRGEVKIIVPEHIKSYLRMPPDEVEEKLGVELALRLYSKGIASFGVARRIAGLTKWEFIVGEGGDTPPLW